MADKDDPQPADIHAKGATTRWSRIEGRDFDYLVKRFWRPVHRFLTARMRSPEDAEEVTQELFCAFVERDLLGRVEPGRGTFRQFLFHCARQFLIDRQRADAAAKRGGGRVVSLEPSDLAAGDGGQVTPEEAFDRDWYLLIINQARQEVRQQFEDQPDVYHAFKLYYFGDSGPEHWSQKRIAESLGIPLSQVNNFVHKARQAFGQRLRAAVGDYTASDEELEQELAEMSRFIDGPRLQGEPPSTLG